ncbi:DUF2971 domain-containing protein [Morganella morganii]|uniref:DUF2971 domain-containing protein n=1 Tax=Morganella morganii TaxID=582 RepID=UPI001647DE9F|nr:DUF2971 domain-containing protein [Morganella morganii]MBC3968196.1 DUF2971 domain-containing protein [Morganella morganii]
MSFYKYMSAETGEKVIKNSTLRWSSPSTFNDIDECQLSPFTHSDFILAVKTVNEILLNCANGHLIYNYHNFAEVNKQIIALIHISKNKKNSEENISNQTMTELITNTFNNTEDYFRDYINKSILNCSRVLCVTSDYDNTLMWAHYADQHRGCVFEFENLYETTPGKLHQGNVQYIKELKSSTSAIELLLYGETETINKALIKDVFFSKKLEWSYEKEYRLLFHENLGVITARVNLQTHEKKFSTTGQSGQLYTDVPFIPESILSITFGMKTNPDMIDKITSIARDKNQKCKFFQMKRSNNSIIRQSI